MKLPSGKEVYASTPIYPGSNFTWGEATRSCTRYPQDLYIDRKLIITGIQAEQNIIATAKHLDEIRSKLGNQPIKINSWYRPRSVNRNIGGSKFSRHQFGDGVDFVVRHLPTDKVAQAIEPTHNQGGYKAYRQFTHIDWRGYRARW